MANTTNFGWETPDDTDLVKDGAAAMRTLGNAIDTSFVDLKGGTTGQVLSKASNTDLDFTWVAQDDSNAIQNAIVDAKGDLISATAADTPARLAVGNDGETLVADSSASTGLRYNPLVNQNLAINGSFDFWQRGTSFTGTSPYYTADRWQGFRNTAAAGATWSRQTASLDGFTYSIRNQRDSGNTSTQSINLTTSFETIQVRNFQGQFLTLSFWAKAGANFSSASSVLTSKIGTGTGTDGTMTTGFTGGADAATGSHTLTTSWQRFSITTTVALASTVTQLGILFQYTPVGTASTNDWFEIAGVQLEVGQIATSWKRCGGTLAGELAACQRYYFRTSYTNQNQANARHGQGGFATTTVAYCFVQHPVPMRISATSVDYSTLALYDYGTDRAVTGVTIQSNCNNEFGTLLNCTVASGGTQYRPVQLSNFNSGSAYLGLNAEL